MKIDIKEDLLLKYKIFTLLFLVMDKLFNLKKRYRKIIYDCLRLKKGLKNRLKKGHKKRTEKRS
jgi:hypothetical protein